MSSSKAAGGAAEEDTTFYALGYTELPVWQQHRRTPAVALLFRDPDRGREVMAEFARRADSPERRQDTANINVTFVEEPDGGYSFYLYPNPLRIGRNGVAEEGQQEEPVEEWVVFKLMWRSFSPAERSHFDRFKPRVCSEGFVLCGLGVDNKPIEESMIFKRGARVINRADVQENDVENLTRRGSGDET